MWWLPEEPDKKISGIITFDPKNGAKLELIGSFGDPLKSELIEKSIILGICAGKKITLYRGFEKNVQISFPGPAKSLFYIHRIFDGAHFKKINKCCNPQTGNNAYV